MDSAEDEAEIGGEINGDEGHITQKVTTPEKHNAENVDNVQEAIRLTPSREQIEKDIQFVKEFYKSPKKKQEKRHEAEQRLFQQRKRIALK